MRVGSGAALSASGGGRGPIDRGAATSAPRRREPPNSDGGLRVVVGDATPAADAERDGARLAACVLPPASPAPRAAVQLRVSGEGDAALDVRASARSLFIFVRF